MTRGPAYEENLDDLPTMSLQTFMLLLASVVAGAFVAVVLLPSLLPGLADSLLGPQGKAYWHLSRSSGFVAYALLWLSMAFGLIVTNKLARLWPGGPVAVDVHQFVSNLSLLFALFHALILLGDRYVQSSLSQVLLPFVGYPYRPLWVGLGKVGFSLLVVVDLSFYARKVIGRRGWRAIHSLSFVVFALALVHGLASGSDSPTAWGRMVYTVSLASLSFLAFYRVLSSRLPASGRGAQGRGRGSAKASSGGAE